MMEHHLQWTVKWTRSYSQSLIVLLRFRKCALSTFYGKNVAEFGMRKFYVDDGFVSHPTSAEAIDLMKRTKKPLKVEGNIRSLDWLGLKSGEICF